MKTDLWPAVSAMGAITDNHKVFWQDGNFLRFAPTCLGDISLIEEPKLSSSFAATAAASRADRL